MKPVKPVKKTKPYILGVDESGRGAWAGPVVAACVGWSGRCPIRTRLGDSKKLSPQERESTYNEILRLQDQGKLIIGIGIIDATVIDAVGIGEANRRAMEKALYKTLKAQSKEHKNGISIKIDGRDNYHFDISGFPEPEYIVRGDSKIKHIMAGSIIAKVTRDRLMILYEQQFPGYGFDRHKGYGTQLHQKALRELGVCEIHRRSYSPIHRLFCKEIETIEKILL